MNKPLAYLLAVNAGSSSIKFAVYEYDSLKKVFRGKIDHIGMEGTNISWTDLVSGEEDKTDVTSDDPVSLLTKTLASHIPAGALAGIGHRVVHGGAEYRETTRVNPGVITALEALSPFAPRHLPAEIALLRSSIALSPEIPQYACFDTSFYRDLPRVAQIIPVPRAYQEKGVRRYGFHGLSYSYLLHHLKENLHVPIEEQKIVLAHMGGGASVTAVDKGKPIDTSMGLTPASGIPMATRSGDLDPGVFEYFTSTLGFTPEKFSHMVNFESGMLGVSDISADMEVLLDRAPTDVRAEEAVALFAYSVRKQIGALAAAMGGIDALVFTGGIGEAAPRIRKRILEGMQFLGMELDTAANDAQSSRISSPQSRVTISVIPTDEEYMIALSTKQALTHA